MGIPSRERSIGKRAGRGGRRGTLALVLLVGTVTVTVTGAALRSQMAVGIPGEPLRLGVEDARLTRLGAPCWKWLHWSDKVLPCHWGHTGMQRLPLAVPCHSAIMMRPAVPGPRAVHVAPCAHTAVTASDSPGGAIQLRAAKRDARTTRTAGA